MKKVGLITMHNVFNMGAVLQSYALQRTINEQGAECKIIDYVPNLRKGYRNYFPKNQGLNKMRRLASWIKWLPQRIKWQKPYKQFIDEHLILTDKTFYENDEIYNYNFNYDVFVTGSDQVWNSSSTDGLSPYYFLDFVKGKQKVSYAASLSELKNSEKDKMMRYLETFNAISVREYHSVNLLKDILRVPINLVLDPTFLLTPNEWDTIALQSKINITEDYLLIYMLGDVPKMLEIAKQIAKEKNLKIVKFGWNFKKPNGIDINVSFGTPQDFVQLFKNAKFVVTNSFHGTAFSINFNKNFISIPSSKRNPRFVSVLTLFGLENHLYEDNGDISGYIEEIDYQKVNNILNEQRKKSIEFITNSVINYEHGESYGKCK